MKKTGIGLGIIAFLTIGFIFIGPYLTLHKIKSAAENQDGAALSEHIDFLALRQSLKDQMNVVVGRRWLNKPMTIRLLLLGRFWEE